MDRRGLCGSKTGVLFSSPLTRDANHDQGLSRRIPQERSMV